MRYGIFADVHANLEALGTVISAYRSESIDQYLSVGDIVGYGTDPNECIKKIENLSAIAIAGNHDWASVGLFSIAYFNSEAQKAISWTESNLSDNSQSLLKSLKLIYENDDLTLVHGTLNNPAEFNYMNDDYFAFYSLELLKTNICFVGHSHVPGIFIQDAGHRLYYRQDNFIDIRESYKYIINVGSVGQPRDADPRACYCIYDTDKKGLWIKRIGYNVHAAARKIINASLPQFLADRLIMGI